MKTQTQRIVNCNECGEPFDQAALYGNGEDADGSLCKKCRDYQPAQHTPTPWYLNGKMIVGATPEDGQIGGAHDVADAAFIVRAVNMIEWYERRLRLILDDIECGVIGNAEVDRVEYVESVRGLELEAIAKATGR